MDGVSLLLILYSGHIPFWQPALPVYELDNFPSAVKLASLSLVRIANAAMIFYQRQSNLSYDLCSHDD